MALKKATKKTEEPKTTGKELQPWEQKMAERAKQAVETASSTGGTSKKIGTRGGVFTIDGEELEDKTLQCVVLDFIVDVTYYEDNFDPDDITPPTASALGRNEKTLVWAEGSHPDYAGKELKDSPVFQWGSADKGRGKAAKSRRRLLLIAADDLEEDIAAAEVRKLMVPVTSGKEWDAYVKQVAAHGRDPAGVLTEITIKSHPKFQFTLSFKMLGLVEDDVMPEIDAKIDTIQEDLMAPYSAWDSAEEEEEEQPAKKSKAVARGAAAKRGKAGR